MNKSYVVLFILGMAVVFNNQLTAKDTNNENLSKNTDDRVPISVKDKPIKLSRPPIYNQHQNVHGKFLLLKPNYKQRVIKNTTPWKDKDTEVKDQ